MKIYIASPFFNNEQLIIVKKVENKLSELNIDYFSPRSTGVLKEMSKDEQQKNKKTIFQRNIREMQDATHTIACIDYKDTGTIFEIGFCYSQYIPVIAYIENISTINVMLAECFYSICSDIKDLKKSLSEKNQLNNLTLI